MKRCWSVVLALFLMVAAPGSLVPAADQEFMADRHKAKGVLCEGCHKEPPPKAVEMKACLACHGDYKALAEKTKHVEPNPHASHEGELECSACHQGHKPGKDYCASCHTFGFKVR